MSCLSGFGVDLIAVVVRILRCIGGLWSRAWVFYWCYTWVVVVFGVWIYAWGASSSNWRTSLFMWWLVTRFGFVTNFVVGFLL